MALYVGTQKLEIIKCFVLPCVSVLMCVECWHFTVVANHLFTPLLTVSLDILCTATSPGIELV